MYSVNVPVPTEVAALARRLAADRPGTGRVRTRGEHTLVLKRLGAGDRYGPDGYPRLAARAREALRGTPAFEARVDGVDRFETPASGPAPVVYLAVESPLLEDLHRRLTREFDPVEGLEGGDYVPHVTVARGGSEAWAERLCETAIEPIEWTVEELVLFDAERGEVTERLSLPR